MGVDLSRLKRKSDMQNIAEHLATQTEKAGDTPLWKTLAGIGVPLLANLALPGIGGALGGFLGKGLAMSGSTTALPSILQGLATKIPAQMLIGRGSRELFGGGDKSSMINLEGLSASEQALGRKAVGKLRGDYSKALKSKRDTGTISDILSGVYSQFGTTDMKDIYGKLSSSFSDWFNPSNLQSSPSPTWGQHLKPGLPFKPSFPGAGSTAVPLKKGGLISDARKRSRSPYTISNGLLKRKV